MGVPEVVQDHPRILLFDGVCNLCSGWMRFVYRRDPRGLIEFAPVQSEAGAEILRWNGVPADNLEMMIFVEEGETYLKSDAFLKVVAHLGFPGKLLALGWAVPRVIRDWLYDQLAGVRYGIFGRQDQCLIPTGDLRSRFVDW